MVQNINLKKLSMFLLVVATIFSGTSGNITIVHASENEADTAYLDNADISEDVDISEGYEYKELDDGTIQITKYTGSDTEIVIPETIDGKTVTSAEKISLAKAVITLSANTYNYDGKAKEPKVESVKLDGITLKAETDYTVSYTNNTNIGTATVAITGKGNHTGTATRTFTIRANNGSVFSVGAYKYIITNSSTVAFCGLKSAKTKTVTIPKTVKIGGKRFKVTSIAANALKDKKVTRVTVGNNVKTIGNNAFYKCTKLTKVTLGSAVTSIGDKAFYGCSKLTDIILPSKVTTIGKGAFANCKKLEKITIKSVKLKKAGKDAFKGIKVAAEIKVPTKKLSAYKKLLKNKGQGHGVKIIKNSGKAGNNTNTKSKYTYEITPLLPPFNDYFYVKTDNPDPTSFRFVDKKSSYYERGDKPTYLVLEEERFMDVVYKKKSTGKVKGGYIFVSSNSKLDGGKLTLQKKEETGFKDTKRKVSCGKVKSSMQYLLDTYTSPSKSFFENMDAVQAGLEELALYPRATKDINKKNKKYPYPLLAISPYPELSLNDHYLMYENAEEPLFLNYLYPYILDSLGFPSVMASVAKRLDSACNVQWGDYHYEVKVTKAGETHYYGGAGTGDSDPLYSNRVEKLFKFNGSSKDYAKAATISKLSKKRSEYGKLADEDAEKYLDLVHGKTFSKKIGMGKWIRVATEFNISGTPYAYVTQGCLYPADSEEIPYAVENIWVDGRYIDQYNKFVPGAKFSQHPKADIMMRNVTYTNKWGKTCRGDITFKYDESSGCWLCWDYAAHSSSSWDTITIEELPDEMILTPKEVKELKVDKNSGKAPSGLIYDGKSKPGTPYTVK